MRVAREFTLLNNKQSTESVARVEPYSKLPFFRFTNRPATSESALNFQIQSIVFILDGRKRSQSERSPSRFCLPVCRSSGNLRGGQ